MSCAVVVVQAVNAIQNERQHSLNANDREEAFEIAFVVGLLKDLCVNKLTACITLDYQNQQCLQELNMCFSLSE